MGGAVLGRDGAAGFGFWTAGELGVGAIGGELGGGNRSLRGDDRLGGSGRRLCRWLYRLRGGEAGFAGELLIFVRGGTAFFAVHMVKRPCGELERPVGGFSGFKIACD